MHSHRRPRGRIFFEAVCALTVGVSFVGAWIQTGAWAFIGPAFVFTLFGLYWAIDMFGQGSGAQVPAAAAPARVPEPEPVVDMESAVMPEIRFERFEPAPEPVPAVYRFDEPEVHTDVVPFLPEPEPAAEPAPVARAEAKPRARKAKAKKAGPVVEQAPVAAAEEPAVDQAPVAAAEEPGFDHHIEQLFDPQPFARQARPAFGKRPRGPGPRPLPAA